MNDSIAPPPTSNAIKYGLVGGILVAIALTLLVCSGEEEPQPEAPPPVADAGVQVAPRLFENEIEIPEEEPDLGVPDLGTEETAQRPRTGGMRAASCEGTIPRAALSAAVRRYRGQVRMCYERALKNNNMLQGRVSVTLRIGAGGQVESARATGSLGSRVNSCVQAGARQWRLVAPTGGTCATVRVPFSMTPSN